MRGLQGAFTKIIVDDIELKDSSSIDGSYQLQFLSLDQVESIEILQGSQSTTYGTDSLAGVIKINTRKGKALDTKFGVGSFATQNSSVYWGEDFQKLQTSIQVTQLQSHGISKINENRFPGAETDSYKNLQVVPKVTYQINKKDKLQFQGILITSDQELDNFNSDREGDDLSTYDQRSFALTYNKKSLNDHLNMTLVANHSEIERFTEVASPSFFDSLNRKIDWRNHFLIDENFDFFVGLEFENNEASVPNDFTEQEIKTRALYITQNIRFSNISFIFSARDQQNDFFEDAFTYKVGSLIALPFYTNLKATHGIGFQAPTLYQLYSAFGNTNLVPTEGDSNDLSLEFKPNKNFSTEFIYFHNDLKDYIDFDLNTFRYANISRVRTYGWESRTFYQLNPAHRFNLIYTYTYAFADSELLPRVPRKKLVFNWDSQLTNALSFNSSLQYVSSRLNSSQGVNIPSFVVIDLGTQYQFEQVSLGFKLYNALNRKYENITLFGTMGRSFYAYTKIKF